MGSSSSRSSGSAASARRQFHPLLQPIGQAADRRLADVLDFQEVDDLLHRLAVFDLFALACPTRWPARTARLHVRQPPGHHVVEYDIPSNSAMFWKVRAMPCRATW
jgi:hypothetical protein